jgi:NAD(P)-dependent dehydrogenase (short-subunit alcohol dehydrogenase family)
MNSARRTRISAKAIYAVTLIVAIAFSISAHAQSAKKPSSSGGAKEKLIGTWHLVHIDAPDPDGKFVPILQPKGMLIYTRDGHMSVQLMYAESANTLSNEYVLNGYEASFGIFDVDEAAHTVTHHVQGSNTRDFLAETADSPRDDYDRVMSINLRGVWSCMKFELRQMREQGSGAIVNCSSLGGLIGGNQRGTYHAAKHGVIGFTKSAALEYATRGIRVNDVCPGMIQTPMSDKMIAEGQGEELDKMLNTFVPMKRFGRPEEIADAVLWLCSDAASYVTGQSISVDGGYVMR